MQTLLTCGAMSKPPQPGEVNAIDPDHLFLSLLRQDLIRDLLFLYSPTHRTFHTLMSVGLDVCGHPSIVHGGFTSGERVCPWQRRPPPTRVPPPPAITCRFLAHPHAAMIDETTGGLVFELKKAGELGGGPAFTARLEVDYKAPIPASADVVCTARLEKVEGRKVG